MSETRETPTVIYDPPDAQDDPRVCGNCRHCWGSTHAEMVALGAECVGAFPKHKFRKVLCVFSGCRPARQT